MRCPHLYGFYSAIVAQHDSIILQLLSHYVDWETQSKTQAMKLRSRSMCSFLEGRTLKHLIGALAPAWKPVRK